MGVIKVKKSAIDCLVKKSTKEIVREKIAKTKMWNYKTKGKKRHVRGTRGKKLSKKQQVKKPEDVDAAAAADQVKDEVIQQAITGVRVLTQKGKEKSKDLMEVSDDNPVLSIQVALWKLPSPPRNQPTPSPVTIRMSLPHTLVTEDTDVLLVTRMLNTEHESSHDQTLNHYKDLLMQAGAASHITEVITARQLRMEYLEYEAKRNLASRFDVVLAQDCVMKLLPKLLGKSFYSKNKRPISVDLTVKDIKKEIEKALSLTTLHLSMKGNSAQFPVGRYNHSDEQLTENMREVMKRLATVIPGGWANIENLSLKSVNVQSVPLYISETPFTGKIKSNSQQEEAVVGSLSTLGDNKVVVVTPDGDVKVVTVNQDKLKPDETVEHRAKTLASKNKRRKMNKLAKAGKENFKPNKPGVGKVKKTVKKMANKKIENTTKKLAGQKGNKTAKKLIEKKVNNSAKKLTKVKKQKIKTEKPAIKKEKGATKVPRAAANTKGTKNRAKKGPAKNTNRKATDKKPKNVGKGAKVKGQKRKPTKGKAK